jgi:hypothetical protein
MNPTPAKRWALIREALAGLGVVALAAFAVWLLSLTCSGCAPLPTGPGAGDPSVVCGVLVGGTDGGGTYTPDEACAAIVATINGNPYCQDAGRVAHPEGCPSTLGYNDGGKCEGARYFCATGIDSIRQQVQANLCDTSAIKIDLTCWQPVKP